MVHCIGSVPGIIVIVIIIFIMNYYCVTMTAIITAVVIVIIMMINTDCHYGKSCMIRRIIMIIVRRIIRHIDR